MFDSADLTCDDPCRIIYLRMIEAENLSKTYRTTPINPFRKPATTKALESVSFQVGRGEAVAVVGRNGAGKTTLLKILATLVLPDGGRAEICGNDVVASSAAVRRKIGIVSGDERSFYWRLSGRENLILFGALHNIPRRELKKRIDSILASLDLTAAADISFRSYSSGMKQRLSLARCLIHEPEALLMDEPNKGIDPLMQARSIEYIRDEIVGRGGRAALLATHNLEEAVALGGKVALLDRGRILFFGKVGDARELRDMMEPLDKNPAHGGEPWL